MPRPDPEQELVPSVLDRLIDLAPNSSVEAPAGRSLRLEQVKVAVRRDLEWLLNSKRAIVEIPEGRSHLATSTLTYGLPDVTSFSLSNPHDKARLRQAIEEAIRKFEPRLSRVSVILEDGRELERVLRFRIDAMLYVEPAPEPISFDSLLQLGTKAFVVQDS